MNFSPLSNTGVFQYKELGEGAKEALAGIFRGAPLWKTKQLEQDLGLSIKKESVSPFSEVAVCSQLVTK